MGKLARRHAVMGEEKEWGSQELLIQILSPLAMRPMASD